MSGPIPFSLLLVIPDFISQRVKFMLSFSFYTSPPPWPSMNLPATTPPSGGGALPCNPTPPAHCLPSNRVQHPWAVWIVLRWPISLANGAEEQKKSSNDKAMCVCMYVWPGKKSIMHYRKCDRSQPVAGHSKPHKGPVMMSVSNDPKTQCRRVWFYIQGEKNCFTKV